MPFFKRNTINYLEGFLDHAETLRIIYHFIKIFCTALKD